MNQVYFIIRSMLFTLALLWATVPAAEVIVDARSAVDYLLSCQKENGAFGPVNQTYSDLAWNYPAVHALILLGEDIPRAADALENGQWSLYDNEFSHYKQYYWEFYQKTMLNKILGGQGPAEFTPNRDWSLTLLDRGDRYYEPYEISSFHDLSSLWYMVFCIVEKQGSVTNTDFIGGYIVDRQSPSGGFVNGFKDYEIKDSEAHVIITYQAVMTLTSLGLSVPNRQAVIDWLRSCQTASGGFRWHPNSASYSNKPDVWYTWAALRALEALGAEPDDVPGCAGWINSLQNADGGFGDRPDWYSRLYSTYYAVHSLDILTGNAVDAVTAKEVTVDDFVIPEGQYSVFVAYLKAPVEAQGNGQAGVVEAMRDMGFDLICPKTTNVQEAVNYVDSQGYDFVVAANPENYPHRVTLYGGAVANHFSNWIYPPGLSGQELDVWNSADQNGRTGLPWQEFKTQVLEPVFQIKTGTLFYPELDWTMVDAYMLYDDGLDGNPGWNAVIAGLGYRVWDWIRMFPHRERWLGQLPFVVDGDVHQPLEEWMASITRQRMLYIAESNSWENFLDACRNNRVVTAIHDDSIPTVGTTFYGTPEAVKYVIRHQDEWRWEQVPEIPVNIIRRETGYGPIGKLTGIEDTDGRGYMANGRFVSERSGPGIYFLKNGRIRLF
jgi:hypothetical protein